MNSFCRRPIQIAMGSLCRMVRNVLYCPMSRLMSSPVAGYSNGKKRLSAVLVTLGLLCSLAVLIRVRHLPKSEGIIELRNETRLSLAEKRDIAVHFSLQSLHQGNLAVGAILPVVKKIHFMYKGFRVDKQFKSLLSSWRMVYPDYQMYFWTDAEIDLLIRRHYPAWQNLYYEQLSNYLERSDVARAFVLDAIGGWYADLDTGCVSRADRHASRHALILPLEPYMHALAHFRMHRLVSNAIMYSTPQHPFWMFYLHRLRQSLVGKKPRESTLQAAFVTGPVLLTEAALAFQQAQHGVGCPGPWCPHLPPPVQFLPYFDNSTLDLRNKFRYMCTREQLRRIVDHVNFEDECRRFRPHAFNNYQLDPAETRTYHKFLHLNEKKNDTSVKSDVRHWRLGLVHGLELVAAIRKL